LNLWRVTKINRYDFSVLCSWFLMIGLLYYISFTILGYFGIFIIGILSILTSIMLFSIFRPIRLSDEEELQRIIQETNWDVRK